MPSPHSPRALLPVALACRRLGVRPTRFLLTIHVTTQQMEWLERVPVLRGGPAFPRYHRRKTFRVSTSRFGTGQCKETNRTPLGIHRVAERIGGGWPVGTAFRSRKPIGFVWAGIPDAPIAHRILWLEGLDPGFNRGGDVDTRGRYIYIHGLANEPTLGRPASRGCIHLAAADLLPLFDVLPAGTLVWIE